MDYQMSGPAAARLSRPSFLKVRPLTMARAEGQRGSEKACAMTKTDDPLPFAPPSVLPDRGGARRGKGQASMPITTMSFRQTHPQKPDRASRLVQHRNLA